MRKEGIIILEGLGENKNNSDMNDNSPEFLKKLIEQSKDNPEKLKIAIGLLKKELEKNPFDKNLHKLYVKCIKNDRKTLYKYINDLVSAFSLTLDYKYYDLILMIISNDLYSTDNNDAEVEAPAIVSELHTLVRDFHEKKHKHLKKQLENLDERNIKLNDELKNSLEENEKILEELDNIKTNNENLQNLINEKDSENKLKDRELSLKTEDLLKSMKEKEDILSANELLKQRLDSISGVISNVVLKQDSQFDKINSHIQQLSNLKNLLDKSLSETGLDIGNEKKIKVDEEKNIEVSEKSEEHITADKSSISERIVSYIKAVENLLTKTNDKLIELKNNNKNLSEELYTIKQEKVSETEEKEETTDIEKKEEEEEERSESEIIEDLKEEVEELKKETESKEELIRLYKEALYEIYDDNHELIASQETTENLLNVYENSLISLLKRRILNKETVKNNGKTEEKSEEESEKKSEKESKAHKGRKKTIKKSPDKSTSKKGSSKNPNKKATKTNKNKGKSSNKKGNKSKRT